MHVKKAASSSPVLSALQRKCSSCISEVASCWFGVKQRLHRRRRPSREIVSMSDVDVDVQSELKSKDDECALRQHASELT
jgi:hypothetical protein